MEDIGEAPYKVERALWQMKYAGVFKGINALILGDFICSPALNKNKELLFKQPGLQSGKIKRELKDHVSQRSQLAQVFGNFANEVEFPVFKGLPLGHGFQNQALPLGVKARISVFSKAYFHLSVNSPFC